MKKIVFVTDVRFWRCRTGAHQRINSLVRYLMNRGDEVTILFAAPLSNGESPDDSETNYDSIAIRKAGLKVISLVDDWSPSGLVQKIQWQGKCILNALSPSDSKANSKTESKSSSATLESLKTFEFVSRTDDLLKQLNPDVVIVEYVTLAYLLPPKTSRGFITVLDSHDLLSSRNRQFQEAGYTHWLEISSEEEFAVFQSFDCVLAIQEHEAETIRNQTTNVDVVVCGHPVAKTDFATSPRDSPSEFAVGYFASNNPANRNALLWLLDSIWPIVMQQNTDARLVLAGTVCRNLDSKQLPASVQVLGVVDSVNEFYDQVDTVLNPIRLGTGLKIKTIEAVQFGLPLISTTHGVEAITVRNAKSAPWKTADTTNDFAAAIIKLASSNDVCQTLTANAREFAQQLSPDNDYGELMRYLDSTKT